MSQVTVCTIKKINLVGKYMEFWFEEGKPTKNGFIKSDLPYDFSSKQGYFWDKISSNLYDTILNEGVAGIKVNISFEPDHNGSIESVYKILE
jgi:hypothetical protein